MTMKTATPSSLILASAFLLFSVSPALSQSAPSRQAVLDMLSGYEHIPSTQELQALGPEVPSVLMQIVQDNGVKKYRRLRALSLLQHYPDNPEVTTFLTSLLSKKDLPSGFRRATLLSLGHAAKGKAIPTLTPYLSSTDTHVREAAAQALMATGDPTVGAILKAAAEQESEPFLKKHLEEMSRTSEADTLNNHKSSSSNDTNEKTEKGGKPRSDF
jgi:HEAT repeat protein